MTAIGRHQIDMVTAMHARLLAPFMMPPTLEEVWSAQEAGRSAGESTIGIILGDLGAVPDLATDADLVIDEHSPGSRAVLLSQRAVAPVQVAGHHGELLLSALGVAVVKVDVEVADMDELRVVEKALLPHANQIAKSTADTIRRHQVEHTSASFEGKVIWWHRILIAPDEERATVAQLAHIPNEPVTVGDGYTAVASAADLDAAAEGLIAATEEWILIDQAYRELLGQLAQMRRATRSGDVKGLNQLVGSGMRMAADLEFRLLVLGERARYLTNLAAMTRKSAVEAWRLEESRSGLRDQVSTVRSVAADARDTAERAMDVRRNNLLYLFTVIAALQGGFVLYDFLSGADAPITSVLRTVFAVLMLGLATISTVLVLTRERRV